MLEYVLAILLALRIFLVILLSLTGKQPYGGIALFFLLLSIYITTEVKKPNQYFIHVLEILAIALACYGVAI